MSSLVPSATPCNEGDVIAGKYRVERVLGVGGMGVVVAAMHVDLDQRVALKFLLPHAMTKSDIAARFAREARAAAKIHSEHVAKVIDVGTLDDGAPYMVMEYLDGEDLEQHVVRAGPLPVDVATSYVLEACEAVAEAHALGIVHRDLKPANLFLANRPSGPPVVKVLDFGISKSTLNTSRAHLTKTSSIVGSPLYMSPEQMASAKSVDTRSDIWALGIVLYQLLSGRTPFNADTMPELVLAVVNGAPDPISRFRPDIPPGLEAVLQRCLEKSPAARYPSIVELAEALAPFATTRSSISVERISHVLGNVELAAATRVSNRAISGSRPSLPQAMTHAQWSQSTASASGVLELRTRRKRKGVLALIIGGAGAMAIAGVLLMRHPTTPVVAADFSTRPVAAAAPQPPPTPALPASSAPPIVAPPSTGTASSVVALTPAVKATPPAPVRHPTVAPRPPPASTSKCHLVSYPDSDGNMRFKQECK